jgi:hypothetical protein
MNIYVMVLIHVCDVCFHFELFTLHTYWVMCLYTVHRDLLWGIHCLMSLSVMDSYSPAWYWLSTVRRQIIYSIQYQLSTSHSYCALEMHFVSLGGLMSFNWLCLLMVTWTHPDVTCLQWKTVPQVLTVSVMHHDNEYPYQSLWPFIQYTCFDIYVLCPHWISKGDLQNGVEE